MCDQSYLIREEMLRVECDIKKKHMEKKRLGAVAKICVWLLNFSCKYLLHKLASTHRFLLLHLFFIQL